MSNPTSSAAPLGDKGILTAAIGEAAEFHVSWYRRQTELAQSRVEEAATAYRESKEQHGDPGPTYEFPNELPQLEELAAAYGLKDEQLPEAIRAIRDFEKLCAESCERSRYVYRIFSHTKRPSGVPAEWIESFGTLSGPISVIVCFSGLARGPELPRDGLRLWQDAMNLSIELAEAALSRVAESATRVRRAGQSILEKVAPFAATLNRAIFYQTGTPFGAEVATEQAADARAELAALRDLDFTPLLDQLAAAVSAESPVIADAARTPVRIPKEKDQHDVPAWIYEHFWRKQQKLLKTLCEKGSDGMSALLLAKELDYFGDDPLASLHSLVTRTNRGLTLKCNKIGASWSIIQNTRDGTLFYCLRPFAM